MTTEIEIEAGAKPGYRTTEFWLTLAVNVGAITATIAETLPPQHAAIALAVSNGLYALARGWAKSAPTY